MDSLSGRWRENIERILEETAWIVNVWSSRKRKIDLCVDFSLLRDLNYYTGFVFQGYLEGFPDPVLTGGSYDHLYELFSGVPKNASGYALVVNTLESALKNPLSEFRS
ncbi:histidine--tRNA ligase [Leptospira ellisii]|nr:histidine--tRNA ligase [Leptospira ellisii]